jgi:hypothetical protein
MISSASSPFPSILAVFCRIELCRPSFNPLVQTKSTMPKQACLTSKTPTPHSRPPAFQHRHYRRSLRKACSPWRPLPIQTCRSMPCNRLRRKTPPCRLPISSSTIRSWMQIHLDYQPVCISLPSLHMILSDESTSSPLTRHAFNDVSLLLHSVLKFCYFWFFASFALFLIEISCRFFSFITAMGIARHHPGLHYNVNGMKRMGAWSLG